MPGTAADRLTVEVVAKRSRRLLQILEMVMGDQSLTPPLDEILIKDRTSGAVVYRESIDEGPTVAATKDAIQADLDALDLAAFCEKYGIPADLPPAP